MNNLLQKNMIIPLTITGVSHDGNGVGRYGNMVVFVPMAAPGDTIEVKIVKPLKSHAFGIINKMTVPSPMREENNCPVYARCGGCSFRHIEYDAEMRIKENWVRENLKRIGKIDAALDPALPSPRQERYRNKAQFPIRRVGSSIHAGFFAKRSHDLIPVRDCLLQPQCFSEITAAFVSFMEEKGIEPYDEASSTGLVRHLYLRLAEATGEIMVCVVLNGGSFPYGEELVERLVREFPDIVSIMLNINRAKGNVILGGNEKILYGRDFITDIVSGVRINISPSSFYQVNRLGAETVYAKALEYAAPSPDDTLLDLYCGAGAIGLSMAAHVKNVIGVEVVESAVVNARQNAALNGIENAEFILSGASSISELGLTPDIIILDPPRKGADKETLDGIIMMNPQRIVYISCDSATLARDCAYLSERGYSVVKAAAADMFPRTAHVECCVLLSRTKC